MDDKVYEHLGKHMKLAALFHNSATCDDGIGLKSPQTTE